MIFKKEKKIRPGPLQQKILLLLLGGFALGLSYTPHRYFRVLTQIGKEWDKINRQSLQRAIRALYESKLTGIEKKSDGTIQLILTEQGKKKALSYKLTEMRIVKPRYWDKKWRVVVFDIPENLRKARDVVRQYLKQFGFYQLQKSVFVIPYECKDELDFLIELYDVRKYVRQFIATGVDNELHLKDIFNL